MYKSKLQELCQRKSWSLPNYLTEKIGPGHIPGFKATVIVNGVSFNTPDLHKHLKEAHNEAARLALSHFTADTPISNIPPAAKPIAAAESTSVIPPSSSSGAITGNTIQSNVLKAEEVAQPNEKLQTSLIDGNSSGSNGSTLVELKHTYKNQLQTYAQKRSLAIPVYSCEQEGPPHASRFRCKVTVSEQTYESPDFFSTLKEAEYAAAKVALMSLLPHGVSVPEENFIFYKNLLQELAQREGLRLPKYSSNVSGESHMPKFVSTVEVEGEIFQGEEAKTKKQAELNAAKVAYIALRERRTSQSHPQFLSANCQLQEATSSSLQSEITVDLQNKSVPKAPHANVFPKEDVEPGIAVDQEASNKVSVESEVSTLQVPAPCINPGTDTRRKRAVPDVVYPRQKDPSPSVPFMPEDGPSSSHCTPEFISEEATDLNFEHPAGVNTLKCKKVHVFSRKLDVKLPNGVIVYSDDKWIALESGPDRTV